MLYRARRRSIPYKRMARYVPKERKGRLTYFSKKGLFIVPNTPLSPFIYKALEESLEKRQGMGYSLL